MRRNIRLLTVLHAGLSWIRLSYTYNYLKTKQARTSLLTMIYCLLSKRTNGGTNGSASGRGFEVHDQCQAQRPSMPSMHICGAQRRQAWLILMKNKTAVCPNCVDQFHPCDHDRDPDMLKKCLGKRLGMQARHCRSQVHDFRWPFKHHVDFPWPFKHERRRRGKTTSTVQTTELETQGSKGHEKR